MERLPSIVAIQKGSSPAQRTACISHFNCFQLLGSLNILIFSLSSKDVEDVECSRSSWHKLLQGAAILLICVSLCACAPVGPDYEPPATQSPGQWQELSHDISPLADRQTGQWWTLLGDPLLDSLVIRATLLNNDLRVAEARIREARAQRIIAAATTSVAATGEATKSRRSANVSSSSSSNRNLFQLGFDADWELDVFGGVRRAKEAAEANLAASREDLRDVLVSLQAEVVRVYVELRGAQMRLATTRSSIAGQQKTVDLVKGRFEVGFGNELDLVQAQTQLSLTESQIPSLDNSVSQSMHQLALLLGQTPEQLIAELTPPDKIPSIPAEIPIDLPSDLLRQRPDIRAAERRLAAATAEIGVSTAELFPKFSLAGLLGLQSSSLSDLFTSGSHYWSIGPVLNLNLFDQGKARAGIEISKARRDAALATYQQTVLIAFVEVENGLVAFQSEQKTLRILHEAVTSGEKAVTIANGLYETGLADFLNVLQSELALYQSQDQLVQSNQRLALAMVSLFKALGGGAQAQSPGNPVPAAGAGSSPAPPKTPFTQ